MWIVEHWEQLVAVAFLAFNAGGLVVGFRGINRRLDQVNGRLNNHGGRIGALETNEAELRGSLGVARR